MHPNPIMTTTFFILQFFLSPRSAGWCLVMDPLRSKVALTALASRLAVIALALVADNLVPDHDAGVFTWVQSSANEEGGVTITDKFVNATLGGLTSWDGQYFLHVADNGYTYENTLAFFPLYPMVVRLLAEVIYWCQVRVIF